MKVLITGATSGIGRQLAEDYHHDGHEVWAVGRNVDALAELMDSGIHTARLELSERWAVLDWCSTLESLDLAILNAGTCEDIDLPAFDSSLVARVFRANVETMASCIEGVLPALRRGASPRLALVGSSAAYLPLPRAEAYGASKAAVAYLANTLRIGLQREGIAVTLICPGFVKTPLTDKNDFPMPMRVEVGEASRTIRNGLARGKNEIHFPKTFTLLLKVLSLLPTWAWLQLAGRMTR